VTTREDRLRAAIQGQIADRPPVALWRHFPVDDQSAETLADATISFHREFDFDFVKVTPASSFCLRDWGVQDAWRGSTEGTREYVQRAVHEPWEWRELEPLDPTRGSLGETLRAIELIASGVGPDVPMLLTVFSPLAQAKNLAGEAIMLEHARKNLEDLTHGLDTIARSTLAFVEAASRRGISGIFYAIQHASQRFFDFETYRRIAERYDLAILEAAGGLWLNVLHLHGEDILFELAESYPVQVVNWHDREVLPTLKGGKLRTRAAVCGGLRRQETLVLGSPDQVRLEAQEALRSLEGRGVILGAGCVVPIHAPRANLLAARRAVDFA